MALSAQAKQKKAAKKTAKRKEKAKTLKTQSLTQNTIQLSAPLKVWASAPIEECLMPHNLFEVGIGSVILTRKMGGSKALTIFLIDVWTLGIKDCFIKEMDESDYESYINHLNDISEGLVLLDPPEFKQLVEAAINHAQTLGFKPHTDYKKCAIMLADIPEPTPCSHDHGEHDHAEHHHHHSHFEFGRPKHIDHGV